MTVRLDWSLSNRIANDLRERIDPWRRSPAMSPAEEPVTYMFPDPLAALGLKPVLISDRPQLERFFQTLHSPLSDYTFSQLFTWRNSLRIAWTVLENHLCVFANGSGDLTMLMPPIGDTGADKALAAAAQIMDQYNAEHGCREKSRVEYVSEELLARFDRTCLEPIPQGTDYLYDVQRMIDLAGGDLASKRQAKNRFMRNHAYRVEAYDRARHFEGCRLLLNQWKDRQDNASGNGDTSGLIKRTKESLATQLTLEHAHELGLAGIVVQVADQAGAQRIGGFTFGEPLGPDQSSIVIEKTDLELKGLAQFIFSEFCRRHWSGRPLVNAGDDWGLDSLAWTKNSYRPVRLLRKFAFAPPQQVAAAVPANFELRTENSELTIRPARPDDLQQILALEESCFSAYNLSRRQLQYLQKQRSAIVLVAEQDGKILGEAIALVRHHRQSPSGRAYSLAVSPEARGQRIGERLMRAMLEKLYLRGVRRVFLEVEQTNQSAVRLYEKLRFRSIGSLPDYYGEGRNGLHMLYEARMPLTPAAA